MFRLLGSVVAIVLLTACGTAASAGPRIKIENAWVRPAAASAMSQGNMPGMNMSASGMPTGETTSAAYFVIVNEGSEADTLIGASTEAASQAETHETRIENNVAKMMPVARVDVPARGRVEFKPAGLHLMLVGVKRELKEGATIKIVLQFEKSGAVTLDVPVREAK